VDEAAENLAPGAPGLGATLAAERERQGLSRADVAHRLHMSPSQVEAIELGDYERLPRGTFLRGFVRNYAKALGIEPEPLLEQLAGAAPASPAPGIVVPTQNIRFDPLGERLANPYVKAASLALVAVAIAFAAMYWAMFVRPRPPAMARHPASAAPPRAPSADARPSPDASTPARTAPAVPSQPAVQAPDAAPAKPAAPQAPAAESREPLSAPVSAGPSKPAASGAPATHPASALAGAGVKRLAFHFTGESWVEVRDASGNVIFQRLNPAGSDAQVSGSAPLEVVVGNAPEVEMSLDGRPFDLDSHTKVAVARFTLE
jgi:cytoskeleton protein RodZ